MKTFCISLQDRGDRREKVLKECSKVGIRPQWVQAVDGRNSFGGVKGCKYSHWFCLKLAQHEHLEKFLVLEDDVEFADNFSLDISDVPDDWDMIYFGGNHINYRPVHVKNNVYKCGYTLCTHAMMIRYTCYDLLMQKILENDIDPVDVIFGRLHQNVNAYVIFPHTAWQADGYSDIAQSPVQYNYLKNWNLDGPN
jgi:GR25 family glycosyltransferase involved in LPS biosynthesis